MKKLLLIFLIIISVFFKTYSQNYKLEAKRIVFETAKFLAFENSEDKSKKNICKKCSEFDYIELELDSLLKIMKDSCFTILGFDKTNKLINDNLDKAGKIQNKLELAKFKDNLIDTLEKKEIRIENTNFIKYKEIVSKIVNDIPDDLEKGNNLTNTNEAETTDNPFIVYKTETWLVFIVFLLLIFNIILFYLVFKMKNKLTNVFNKTSNIINNEKFNSSILDLKSETNNKISNEVGKLNERIIFLEKKINEISNTNRKFENQSLIEDQKTNTFKQETFYAQYPDSTSPVGFTGFLEDSNPRKIYIITTTKQNLAVFTFTSNVELQNIAIKNHNSFLKDACIYTNQPSPETKGFTVISEGQIEKIGNVWQVTKKANIRFI